MCKIPAIFRFTAEMASCFVRGFDWMVTRREIYYNWSKEEQAALLAGKRIIKCMRSFDDYVPKSVLITYKSIALDYIKARRNYEKVVEAFEALISGSFIENQKTAELYLSDAIAA